MPVHAFSQYVVPKTCACLLFVTLCEVHTFVCLLVCFVVLMYVRDAKWDCGLPWLIAVLLRLSVSNASCLFSCNYLVRCWSWSSCHGGVSVALTPSLLASRVVEFGVLVRRESSQSFVLCCLMWCSTRFSCTLVQPS